MQTSSFKVIAIAAFTAAAAISAASAADMAPRYTKAPPAAVEVYDWTGFYIGGNVGYSWGRSSDTSTLTNSAGTVLFTSAGRANMDGVIGGGQIGFNWQWNNWLVLGAETDFQGSDMEGHDTRFNFPDIDGVGNGPDTFLAAHERIQWFGTARGRIGFAPLCRLLVYATGGLAYGNVDYSANTNFDNGITYPVSFTRTSLGWTVGGGLEYAISHHWSVKAEYLYYDLGDEGKTQNQLFFGVPQGPPFFVHYNFEDTGNIVRGGLNYKF